MFKLIIRSFIVLGLFSSASILGQCDEKAGTDISICDECKKEDESVSQNLILTSYKLCSSCRVSKTIFPI